MASDLPVWDNKWKEGKTGWHRDEVNTHLEKFHEKLLNGREAQTLQIFIPLCGKTLDMKFLYEKGHKVVGVEAVHKPIEEFFQENDIQFEKSVFDGIEGGADLYQSTDGRLKIFCCDLFKFNKKCCGLIDGVWDRASLVAIDPDLRPRYITLMKELLAPDFRYLSEVVEYDKTERKGYPDSPHPIMADDMKEIFESFVVEKLNTISEDTKQPAVGWRKELSWLNNSCYIIYSKVN